MESIRIVKYEIRNIRPGYAPLSNKFIHGAGVWKEFAGRSSTCLEIDIKGRLIFLVNSVSYAGDQYMCFRGILHIEKPFRYQFCTVYYQKVVYQVNCLGIMQQNDR